MSLLGYIREMRDKHGVTTFIGTPEAYEEVLVELAEERRVLEATPLDPGLGFRCVVSVHGVHRHVAGDVDCRGRR